MLRFLILTGLGTAMLVAVLALPGAPLGTPNIPTGPAATPAAPEIYASPIHGGCYIAGPSDCRIHLEPMSINVQSGEKMLYFQLLANPAGYPQTVIYDWRPDLSNPLPYSGATVNLSLVTQDFAATCGRTYTISLVGQDTGDPNPYVLGGTGEFTCPSNVP